MNKAEKILEQMRNTKNGWKPDDFATLFEGYGFNAKEGANHMIYIHGTYNSYGQR